MLSNTSNEPSKLIRRCTNPSAKIIRRLPKAMSPPKNAIEVTSHDTRHSENVKGRARCTARAVRRVEANNGSSNQDAGEPARTNRGRLDPARQVGGEGLLSCI